MIAYERRRASIGWLRGVGAQTPISAVAILHASARKTSRSRPGGVMRHRIVLTFDAEAEGLDADAVGAAGPRRGSSAVTASPSPPPRCKAEAGSHARPSRAAGDRHASRRGDSLGVSQPGTEPPMLRAAVHRRRRPPTSRPLETSPRAPAIRTSNSTPRRANSRSCSSWIARAPRLSVIRSRSRRARWRSPRCSHWLRRSSRTGVGQLAFADIASAPVIPPGRGHRHAFGVVQRIVRTRP